MKFIKQSSLLLDQSTLLPTSLVHPVVSESLAVCTWTPQAVCTMDNAHSKDVDEVSTAQGMLKGRIAHK